MDRLLAMRLSELSQQGTVLLNGFMGELEALDAPAASIIRRLVSDFGGELATEPSSSSRASPASISLHEPKTSNALWTLSGVVAASACPCQ